MLHDTLTPDQVVDSEAAREFLLEATKLATATELEDIGERLEAKGARFGELLAPEALARLDEKGFGELTGSIFSLRRKAKRLLAANGLDTVRTELEALVHGESPVGERLERFVQNVTGLERAMILALATESLHFFEPRRYWLWTHWIWSPEKGTGALPLVIRDEIDLAAPTLGGRYLEVGRATALLNAQGHAAGWARSGRGLYGTDVFLASVYAVYMYTVFRVKLSQEFNRILPELPELVGRVLGVQRRGETDGR